MDFKLSCYVKTQGFDQNIQIENNGLKESLIPDVILELDFLALEAVLNIEISLLLQPISE